MTHIAIISVKNGILWWILPTKKAPHRKNGRGIR